MQNAKTALEICLKILTSKMCNSVSRQVATSVECKTRTDVKQDFDKVASGCDQSIVINTDCTKIVVSYKLLVLKFTVYGLGQLLMYLPIQCVKTLISYDLVVFVKLMLCEIIH